MKVKRIDLQVFLPPLSEPSNITSPPQDKIGGSFCDKTKPKGFHIKETRPKTKTKTNK